MNTFFKKALLLFSSVAFFAATVSAQQNHFIYLQTENKQPFYIKLDSKVLSSSSAGYLIVPKLQDGSYALTIGFPKNEWPEQNVTCKINNKDLGYIIKNFGEKGWGLFNLQTMEVVTANSKATAKAAPGEMKQDIFSNTLSNVVNDPSIAIKEPEKPVVKEEVKTAVKEEEKPVAIENKKADETPATIKEETKTAIKEEEKPAVVKEETKPVIEIIKKEEPAPVQNVKRLFTLSSSEGTDMVYVDMVNGVSDTVRLFVPKEKNNDIIPVEKKEVTLVIETPKQEEVKKEETSKLEVKTEDIKKDEPAKEPVKTEEIKKDEPVKEPAKIEEVKKEEPIKQDSKGKEPKFIDMEVANPNAVKKDTSDKPIAIIKEKPAEPVKEVENAKPATTAAKPLIFNSDCKGLSSEEDFLKLRKKMAAADNDDDMITAAKKAFKSKCYTTDQIKNLSVLFLKDDGKYKFFDAAYPFVSDSYNFSSLQSQLTDDYYISRFKAMIKH